MPTLTAEAGQLVVGLSPLERLAALRGDVRLPLAALRSVSVEPTPWAAVRGVRAPGTGVPGVILYATMRVTGDRNDFVAILGRNRPAVLLEFDPPAEFARVLVVVANPALAVAGLAGA